MLIKPILRWPGSKTRHIKTLLPLIKPHVCYVEPFAGGLAMMLAKERSDVEVVNDLNRSLVCLYRCIQFHREALLEELKWQISARANFADMRENSGLTDLQRASRFLVLNLTSFAGNCSTFGVVKTRGGGIGLNRERIFSRIEAISARLDRVTVECLDWERCVKLYDSPETFFFIDPPYLDSKIKAYDGFSREQMTRLAEVLKTLQGQWVLTTDSSDFCRELFSPWKSRVVTSRKGTVNHRLTKGMTFGEIITVSELAG